MMYKLKRWVVLLLCTTVFGFSGCNVWFDTNESHSNFESRYFAINSLTILDSLDQGKTDIFTLLESTPQARSSTYEEVSWSQADYLRIAKAIYQQAWQESLEAQDIYSMTFKMDCEEIEQGLFNEAEIISFIVLPTDKEETRREFHTYIRPPDQYVFTMKEDYTPNIQVKTPINLAQYRISAEEAVQIAEQNGATERRLKFGNDCTINVLAPGSVRKGWSVSYSNNKDGRWDVIFEIAINPFTGDIEILNPKQ